MEERSGRASDGKKHCLKCLLREMDQDAYFKNLYAYIEGLDDTIRAPEPVYEERLACCRRCERLADGMCRACGCFVELRAAIAANCCPYDVWRPVRAQDA